MQTEFPLIIDISGVPENQQNMTLADFEALKEKGAQGVIIQITYGSGGVNPFAKQQLDYAKQAGMHAHAYHFSYAVGTDAAKQEAEHALTQFFALGFDPDQDFLFVDEEDKTAPYNATDDVNAFLQYWKDNEVANIGTYSMASWFTEGRIKQNQLISPILWVANYGVNQPGVDGVQVWQFTDNWNNIDASYDFNGILLKNDTTSNGNHTTGTQPVPEPVKPVEYGVGHGTVVEGETVTSIANTLNDKYGLNLKDPVATFVANNSELFPDGNINNIYPGEKYVFYYEK